MKKLLLFLLLLPALAFGQSPITKKHIHHLLATQGGGAPSTAITSVTYAIDTIHYTNEAIVLAATPNVSTTNSSWRIIDESGVLQGLEFGNSVSITTVTTPGFYTIVYEALTATDRIIQTWDDMVVDLPRFTEGEADLVINMASSNYYNDFAGADNSGMKIYVKGTGTGYLAALNLRGSAGWDNYVRIQVDNASGVNQTGVSASDVISLTGGRYIRVNGYKSDKSKGWTSTAPTGAYFGFRIENTVGFTDIMVMGMNIIRTGATNDRAALSWIPPVNVTYNASNWVATNLTIYNCYIKGAGAEGIYLLYTNDLPQSTYTPPKARNVRIVWNKILNSGNDAIQYSSCINLLCHDNWIDTWGLQGSSGHEAAISHNEGNSGRVYNNYAINGKMFMSAKSGLYPYDIEAGGSTPLPLYVYNNVGIEGTPPGVGGTEPVFNYIQANNTASTATWPVHWVHNSMKANKLGITFAFNSAGGYRIPNLSLFNNAFSQTGGANEYAYSGAGTYPTTPVINNVVRTYASDTDLLFTSATNLKPTSTSSPLFTGATTTSTYISGFTLNDKDGYPLLGNSYVHGAYNLYNQQTISPAVADGAAATISPAVAVGTLTPSGGTITFEANKEGVMYWVVVADGATAPTAAQIKAGGYLASGKILDGGTAQSGLITGLSTPSTAYDLYTVYTTRYYVNGTVTKTDFTTTADTIAPTLSGWEITNAQPGRIYFNSSEVITATTFGGFTIGSVLGTVPTVTGVTINTGSTTGHYFTMSANFGAIDYNATIAYSGSGSNLQDGASNALVSFAATSIANNIVSTRINVNIRNNDASVGGNWNNAPVDGSGAVRSLIANLIDDTGSSTGFALAIQEAFHNSTAIATSGGGLYLNAFVGARGIECYSTSVTSNAGTLRISGLPAGATGQIVYGTKGIFNTPTGTVLVTGGSSVAFANAYTEYRQAFVADGSGNLDITMTQTTSNASICMVGFIIELNP
jgi:hypothetical protein